MKKKIGIFAITSVLVFSIGINDVSAVNYIGAYCGPDDWFSVDQTRNFVSAWDGKGGVDQWYWSADYQFSTQNNSYVDWEDFSYYVGNAGPFMVSHTGTPSYTNLTQAGNNSNNGWGGYGGGYAKYVVFDTSLVVPSSLEGDAFSGWMNEPGGVWDGVLQLIGYHTVRYISTIASTPFGKKVSNGEQIFYAWFASVDSVANHTYGADYASITWCSGSDNDTYPNGMDAPCPDNGSAFNTYQY